MDNWGFWVQSALVLYLLGYGLIMWELHRRAVKRLKECERWGKGLEADNARLVEVLEDVIIAAESEVVHKDELSQIAMKALRVKP